MMHFIMSHSAETGLLLFFVCFAAIGIFAATRTHAQLDDWAKIPISTERREEASEYD